MIKLAEKPEGIEHIYEIRDWMETIPMSVRQQDELTRRYVLVLYQHNFSNFNCFKVK